MEPGSAWWGRAVLSLHGSMASNVGAAVCPSKGSWLLGLFLLVGGISLPFNLVFTANSAKALCKQQVAHSGLFGTAPMGRAVPARSCGGMQMVNKVISPIWGISCN